MAQMVCTQLLPNALGTRPQAQNAAGGMQQGAQAGTQAGMQTGVQAGVQAGGTAAMSALILNQGTIACTYDTKVNSGNLVSLGGQTLSVSYYTAQGTVNVLGGSPQQVEMIKDFIVKTDKKQPQAYLEVSIIELNESGSKTLANIWEVNSKFFNASFNNDGNTKVNELLKNRNRYPEYPHVFSTNPHVSYSINYLVENKKARVVANPRILITNGQKSVIDMTSDYVKTVTSQVIQGMTGAPAVQRTYEIGEDQGIKVNITPFISPDGYVTLDIAPEYSVQAGQIYATNADGAETKDLMATLLSRRNLDLKSVRIKDGETLVIGGMINEKESKTIQKVPVLGDLPLIGSLFRSTGSEKTKEEMIIMLTPKIINDTDGRETL
jgi:type IV pilus assembly protein PilQ